MSQAGTFLNGVFPPGIVVQELTGNVGGPVGPDGANNINILGTGDITVTGNPGTNTLTISSSGAVADSFPTNAGTAIPVAGSLNIFGSHGINTTGVGNTVTALINNAITLGDLAVIGAGADALTVTTGDVTISSGNLNLPTTADANNGVIEVNGTRFIHSFGGTNTFVGASTGNFTMTGFSSVGIGTQALEDVTSGAFNVAIGFLSQANTTSGGSNVSMGSASLTAAVGASSQNVAIGASAINTATTPNNNIAIGYFAGSSWSTTESDNIAIGTTGTAGNTGTIRIGTQATHTTAFMAGIDGVNVGSTAKVVTLGTAGTANQLGTATITAGGGIVVTPNANTITISGTGGGLSWSVITADQIMDVNHGYICNKAGLLQLQFPATSSVGDIIAITNENIALGVDIALTLPNQVLMGNTTGSLIVASAAIGDTLQMVCITQDYQWRVISMVGNWTIQ